MIDDEPYDYSKSNTIKIELKNFGDDIFSELESHPGDIPKKKKSKKVELDKV